MSYIKTQWNDGDLITAEKLNKMEDGILNNKGEKGDPGEKGQDGVSPTIEAGEVTTLEPNEKATVINSVVDGRVILSFGIPKGEKGEQGNAGEKGEQGNGVTSIELVKDGTGAIVSGTVTFTNGSTAPITITTQEA